MATNNLKGHVTAMMAGRDEGRREPVRVEWGEQTSTGGHHSIIDHSTVDGDAAFVKMRFPDGGEFIVRAYRQPDGSYQGVVSVHTSGTGVVKQEIAAEMNSAGGTSRTNAALPRTVREPVVRARGRIRVGL